MRARPHRPVWEPLRDCRFRRRRSEGVENRLEMVPSFVQLTKQERNTASIDGGPSVSEFTAVVAATDAATDPSVEEPELYEKRKEFAQYFAQKNIFRARPSIVNHDAIWQASTVFYLRASLCFHALHNICGRRAAQP